MSEEVPSKPFAEVKEADAAENEENIIEGEEVKPEVVVDVPAKRTFGPHNGLPPLELIEASRIARLAGRQRVNMSAGKRLIVHINHLAKRNEHQLKKIARDKSAPFYRRAAANVLYRGLQLHDIADFDEYLSGEKSMGELSAKMVFTPAVKRAKETVRFGRKQKDGTQERIVSREIELAPQPDAVIEQIVSHTHGSAIQRVKDETKDNKPQLDFSKLTKEEQDVLRNIRQKMLEQQGNG